MTNAEAMPVTAEEPVSSSVELLGRARQGDADAFCTLIRPLTASAHRVAAAILCDRTEAEDAVQDASARAWKQLRTLRDPERLRSWYFQIVVNESRRRLGHSWHRVVPLGLGFVSTAPRGDDRDGDLDVRRALLRLSVDHRVVVVLRHCHDLTVDQIANELGVPAGTVKSRLNRGTERLRHLLHEAT